MARPQYQQEPIAIVGFACRLPGGNDSPQKLWEFLERGEVASNTVPKTRFNVEGHYDGSHKPGTMRPLGGMFLGNHDLAEFDASFFEISGGEAVAMDPNQRQMLEVVIEGLENAGITLESMDGAPVACFAASYACDYADMQNRDVDDRPVNSMIGVGRAILANRLSYFLNTKGPSVTIDTACSGSLVGLDMACRSLQSGEVHTAIVAAANLYMNPDNVMDSGAMGAAHSPTALCHTFDAEADGYVRAEAVSCLIVKRLSDAIQDRDPIRAVIRGTASNSNGRTGGIGSPDSVAQAAAIRTAYANAGITNFRDTDYLECHGTGTKIGDPTEVNGAASVFSASRDANDPLIIGSIKGNVGHSEPAAGNSGVIKTILAMEKGIIPGNPLFKNPNPKIDFVANKVKASRAALPWPDVEGKLRRASVNSFGYGGSNAHVILDQPEAKIRDFSVSSYAGEDQEFDFDDEESPRPYTLIVSANDPASLKANVQALCNHLLNPRVRVQLPDLAYTLTERRTKHWHRAFVTTNTAEFDENAVFSGKKCAKEPKIGFVFTGQGAQWSQMGRDLLELFPWTRAILDELDDVLQAQSNPPKWSLLTELTEARSAEHLRQPEFSQPLVTALQLCIIAVLESWGIKPSSVVGHSSGEIAAAYAAGLLNRASAIKAAFYRGRAAVNRKAEAESDVGMLAVGMSADAVGPFLEKYAGSAWIACFNSPSSLTVSGKKPALEALAEDIKAAGQFARLLQVDLAYHSELMQVIGEEYDTLLNADKEFKTFGGLSDVTMFSSVTTQKLDQDTDALYWKTNMVSPVRFAEALKELVMKDAPDMLIEIGPSGALAGPVSQTLKEIPTGSDVSYAPAWSRGSGAGKTIFDVAGKSFVLGAPVNFAAVNQYDQSAVRTLTDLPNYAWNHANKYWHENAASKDWRYKQFIAHDTLGSKIPGTTWHAPTWRKHLNLADVPWLRDHKMGPDILFPGAGLVTLALEAMFQKYTALNPEKEITSPNELAYRFRNVRFDRAVVVEENKTCTIMLTLAKVPGSQDWHEFRIRTVSADDTYGEHTSGLVRVSDPVGDAEKISGADLAPLNHPQSAKPWYKALQGVGMNFGPTFQEIKQFETVSGSRRCRAIVSMKPPPSKWDPQTYYPIHPAVLDACGNTAVAAYVAGERSLLKDVMVPSIIDDVFINTVPKDMHEGLSIAESIYTGRGRKELGKSWKSDIAVHDPETGALIMRMKGVSYVRLDVDEKPDPHVFQTATWKPDISLLTQDQLMYLLPSENTSARVDAMIDLIAFKKPLLKVLEINLDPADISSLWLQNSDVPARAAYSQYDFASTEAKSLVSFQSEFENKRNVEALLITPTKKALGLSTSEPTYDLAIIKVPAQAHIDVRTVIKNLKPLLQPDAFTVLFHEENAGNSLGSQPKDIDDVVGTGQSTPAESDESSDESDAPSSSGSVSSYVTSAFGSQLNLSKPVAKPMQDAIESTQVKKGTISSSVMKIPTSVDGTPSYVWNSATAPKAVDEQLMIVSFDEKSHVLTASLESALKKAGWAAGTMSVEEIAPMPKEELNCPLLVLDELSKPMLSKISAEQWEALKQTIASGRPILWVTKGAQTSRVTNPENAMVQGLFRTARRENPDANLTTLDVEYSTSSATDRAIVQVLQKLRIGTDTETEYSERGGVLYIQRVLPDDEINDFKAAEGGKGLEPVVKNLHDNENQVRIQAEKVGTLQSLTWTETADHELPVAPGFVEVEVMAVGVNFKDVATTMGIVPENEHMIGCENAGFVKRLGPGVTKFKVGDRVVVQNNGTYVNRIQAPTERTHVIPKWMSFEDAATIPLVYLTAIYSLYHLGGLRKGQTVLIHSAAGGVGMAAIQLAQYKKAEIYVTVGSEEKRKFLKENFGIPEERMFSSRNTKFADEIRRATNDRGIDVILNSLIGELLDESWRLTADGGIMVEIGKRDIVDRNSLSMEPFDRNCSFRAVDLSYTKEISDELIEELLDEVFDLVEARHVGPIHPITTFSFDKVIDALSYIRSGQHMGKIVISDMGKTDITVPIKPAIRQLSFPADASYLIVGGLKGLCGSVAVHMARCGAKHIIVMSRSGTDDEASAKVIENCATYDCEIIDAQGDVGDMEFVRQTFKNARSLGIAGIIQGAMVLRDKPYEMMTHDDWQTAIHAKVAGTWNLHNAAADQKMPLDFFTMLSSISGVVGNKGQANYAAANTFLDAFASYRRTLGLHANTVDLGMIEDVGFIAEQGDAYEARFDKKQWTPVNENMLRRVLGYSIFQQGNDQINVDSGAQLITGLAYPLPANDSDLVEEPRFSYLFNSHGAGDGDAEEAGDGNDKADQALKALRMMHASGAETPALVKTGVELLQAQISKVLRLENEMEPGKPLMAYGLVSLSAVEIRGWIRQKVGAELSTLDITNASSLIALGEKMVSKLPAAE